jgi:hypothetical protein
MTNTLERLSVPTGEGNVWRRIGALVIDWAVIAAGVCVCAAVAYGLSGGQIRMAQAPLSVTDCVAATAVPEGFDPNYRIPGVSQEAQARILGDVSTFQADVISDCRTRIMGSEIDRSATIAETSQAQRYFILPVDRDFRVTRPWLHLDHVFGLAMLLVLTLLESGWRASGCGGETTVGPDWAGRWSAISSSGVRGRRWASSVLPPTTICWFSGT